MSYAFSTAGGSAVELSDETLCPNTSPSAARDSRRRPESGGGDIDHQYPYATSIDPSKRSMAPSHSRNRVPSVVSSASSYSPRGPVWRPNTSYGESSIDAKRSKIEQAARLRPRDADETLVPPRTSTKPIYECTFSFLGCRFTTPDESDWRLHNLGHFQGNSPPRSVACQFCDRTFEGADGGAVWEMRMTHLAVHIGLGATQAISQPDSALIRHLWQKRIIDEAEYMVLRAGGSLALQKPDISQGPIRTVEAPHSLEKRGWRSPLPGWYNTASPDPPSHVGLTPLLERTLAARKAARIPASMSAANEEEVLEPQRKASQNIENEFLEFMTDELREVEDLLEVIVVTGTEDRAFVAPCASYAERMWPGFGTQCLRSLVSALKPLRSFKSADNHRALEIMKAVRVGRSLRVSALLNAVHFLENQFYLRFTVEGDDKEVSEFLDILTWLSAACRIPVPDKLLCSHVDRLNLLPDFTVISHAPLKPLSGTSGSGRCWHNMFKGYVLAKGFPIPDRGSQRGVELPFDVMTLLGLVLYPVNFGKGIVLKGENTALIPSICEDDEDCVQWHYLEGDGANGTLSWDLIKEHCGNIFPTKDFKLLQSKRTFVGYFPSVKIHLGTRDSEFDKVDFSGAAFDDKTAFVLGNELVGQVGTSVMNFFTAQVSGKLMVHRTAHQRLRGIHDSILDKVRNSKDLPLLLFDVTAKQGWLLPELSALLHMALAWASYQHEPDQVLRNMPFAEARSDGGKAAYDAILRSANLLLPEHIKLGDNGGRQVSVFQALTPFFARIGQIKDQQLQRYACGLKENRDLVGYEFKEIASFEEHLHLRRSKVDVDRSGGWLRLVSSKPEMAVILCSHLKAPIRPASTQISCPLWQTIPVDQYYLTASMSCLRQLAKRCGGEESLRLYNDIYCTPCKKDSGPRVCGTRGWPCCNPLFELSKHPSKVALRVDDQGALIIGKALPQTDDHSSLRIFLRSLYLGKYSKAQSGTPALLLPNHQPLNGTLNIPLPQPSVSSRIL